MPKYKLEWSDEASQEYEEIRTYLIEHAPWYAVELVRDVDKSLWPLAKWPRFYPVYAPARKYRKIVVGSAGYIILYRVLEKQRIVIVERMFHGARNIRALL